MEKHQWLWKKLRKIEEKFKKRKILYNTQSESLLKQSKELHEYEYYDGAAGELKIGVPEQVDSCLLTYFLKK